jgi:hypothetical protein
VNQRGYFTRRKNCEKIPMAVAVFTEVLIPTER